MMSGSSLYHAVVAPIQGYEARLNEFGNPIISGGQAFDSETVNLDCRSIKLPRNSRHSSEETIFLRSGATSLDIGVRGNQIDTVRGRVAFAILLYGIEKIVSFDC
ncbi:MAG: hypothetical protein CMJ46_15310 [Planctomyces sp.]|nr:hypothetical protein [Planctomyces sp.]